MKIIDIKNPQRVNRNPDKVISLFSSGNFTQNEFLIKSAELRLYQEKSKPPIDSIITLCVDTDKGSIETTYEEGNFDFDYFDKTVKFVIENLGISTLILRSLIELRNELDKHNR